MPEQNRNYSRFLIKLLHNKTSGGKIMFIGELLKLILQGSFLIILAWVGHVYFSDDIKSSKYPKIITILLNILK
jgi:hypothetical protein